MIETWQWLREEGDALLRAVAEQDQLDAAAITRLRKLAPPEAVTAAIELTHARRKGAHKFPNAARLWADTPGMEQATDHAVAHHKAARFQQAGITHIHDLCCGIGGDAMALASIADVTLIDNDPLRIWMAQQNVRTAIGREVESHTADVTTRDLQNQSIHLDPARRAGARRLHHYEDYQPGPDFIADLLARCPDSAIKLGPGVDLDALPPGEVELIEHDNTLVQAVLWSGRLARSERAATVLPAGQTLTGSPEYIPVAEPADYLFAVRPCVERAELIGNLCTQTQSSSTHPRLGLLTADHLIDSPFLTPFRHLETMPWREKKARQWLAEHDGGAVEIKTRGGAVNPDPLQLRLRGQGQTPHTLFILRYDDRLLCHITQRL